VIFYETRSESGATLDVVTDEASGLRLVVNRLGAEMIGLERRAASGEWVGFLYRDGEIEPPAKGWANHATLMGYFLHRLWKEQSVYRGAVIKGGNHGFLRHFAFDAPEQSGDGLIYRVPVDRIPPEAYPLKVSLEIRYLLRDGGARVEFSFTNEEKELDAHVSFGVHPGFAVTSVESCRVLFPAGTYIRYFAPGNFLDGKTEEIPFAGGEMPFAKATLPDSYLLSLEKVSEKIFVVEDPASGRRVRLDFSEVPYLTVWSDMNPFICVEPCWGLPDSNPPLPFEEKVGIQHIAPGGTLTQGFHVAPDFLP